MSKLLRANFFRLFKSRLFRFCITAIFAAAVFAVFDQEKYTKVIDGMLFSGISIISIVSAVFISIFAGTEYSDGTMRNKLYMGHSRISVYGASLVTCAAAAVIMHIVLIAAVVCFGILIIGKVTMTASEILLLSLLSILTVTAYASVYILLGILITSKAAGVAAAILLSFGMIIGADTLYRCINTPEYSPSHYIDEELETGYGTEFVPNPRYPSKTKRKVMQAALNILPSGQALQIASGELPENTAELPLYAIADIAVTTVVGIMIFRRKDIK
ncbi:MAG: ABC transporter permease [Oscillospiraceae bacterium]|nr:ABC transporter permease [Oscillospiraceae bacterium]